MIPSTLVLRSYPAHSTHPLSQLHLGVRNIRLGPRLPAFLTPAAVKVLVDAYNLPPADEGDPEADVKRMLQKL